MPMKKENKQHIFETAGSTNARGKPGKVTKINTTYQQEVREQEQPSL